MKPVNTNNFFFTENEIIEIVDLLTTQMNLSVNI